MSNVLPFLSREQVRSRRKHPVRAHTIHERRITKRELAVGTAEIRDVDVNEGRPITRGDCASVPRPCPYVTCKHNLYLDVNVDTGSIKLNFPHIEPEEMKHSCALDIADGGGLTLEDCADVTNLTRERIRQIEFRSLVRIRKSRTGKVLGEFTESREPIHSAKTSQGASSRLNRPMPSRAEEPVDTEMDDIVRLSFFADASAADSEFDARFFGESFVPSRAEEQLTRNVDRMYTRRLLDRGLIEPKQLTEGQLRAKSAFAPPKPKRRDRMAERREQVVAAYKKLETELGRKPSSAEVAEEIGEGFTKGNVDSVLYKARKLGLLPKTVPGGGPRAPRASRETSAPKAKPVKAKRTSFSSSFEDALREELERVDARRARIIALLEAS